MIRKQDCVGANFTMMRTIKNRHNETIEVQYANVDHSEHIFIKEFEPMDGYSYQEDENGEDVKVRSICRETGLCSVCDNMLKRSHWMSDQRDNWAMIPFRPATHTIHGQPLESEGEE